MENVITSISSVFHPTTIVFVDDRWFFLKAIDMELDPAMSTRGFLDPQKAIEFVKQHCHQNYSLTKKEQCENQGRDYSKNKLYDPNRFCVPTVVVVDEYMPGIDGLSLCGLLQDCPIKTIVLTDGFKEERVMDAYENGSIDYFISRGRSDFGESLNRALLTFQQEYFLQNFPIAFDDLLPHSSCLSDPLFIQMFQEVCKKYGIVEYYLLEDHHSFLLFNEEGHKWWLFTATISDIDDCYKIAKHNDAPSYIVSQLAQYKTLAYINDFQHLPNKRGVKWEEHVVLASRLREDKPYYYGLTDHFPFEFDKKNWTSFAEHVDSILATSIVT